MTVQEKIRPGYKQTEVGAIPEDWEVKLLPQAMEFIGGKAHEKHIRPYGNFSVVNSKFISSEGRVVKYSNINFCPARRGDVLMVMSDLPNGKALAKCFLVEESDRFAVNQRVCILRPRNADSKFFYYQLNRNPYFLAFDDGVQQTHLLNGVFRACPVIVPPSVAEQNAIAEALSDADARVTALESLIAKKRDLKQAAMQQLLTGKTRLPGFSGEWEVKRLGELLDYEQPTKYLVQSTEYDESCDIPVLTAGKSFYLGRTNETNGVCRSLPVIIFDDFTTATQFVDFPFKAKSSAMKLLRPRDRNTDINLVYALMQGIKFTMSDHKRYWISEYQKIELPFPGPEEQAAISEIISDMDAELAALEADAEKARTIKQGMMQNLLTGKVRLV